MTPESIGLVGLGTLLFFLFVLGTPVGFSLALIGFVGFASIINFSAASNMIASTLWGNFSGLSLTAIPLFILMGNIAHQSGINEKLYKAAYCWFGHIRGGMALATVLSCAAFSMICGSNAATAATMSTITLPQMKKYGYNPLLSAGAVASGSTLGVVIPPSVVLIILGLTTEQSIARLFYGAIGAGLLLTTLLALSVLILCHVKKGWGPAGKKHSFKEKFSSLQGTLAMLVLFSAMMGGLYGGFFTPTEAGAAGSFMAVLIGIAGGELKIEGIKVALAKTLSASCMVILITVGAIIFGKFLTIAGIPRLVADSALSLSLSPSYIVLFIFLIYIIGGALMDALALLLITLPIFFPVAVGLGLDPIWFAVIITVITTLGAITPPVGATTYVVAGLSDDISLMEVIKGVCLFLPAFIVTIALLILFPGIITWLPALIQ